MADTNSQIMGGVSGAASGGMAGMALGGPVGGAIGLGLGAAMGAGAFGGSSSGNGYNQTQLDTIIGQRNNQINQFAQALSSARNQYYNVTLPKFQTYAMSRFMPQIEAQYAGRGLQVSGGAFGSALARAAGDFQAQQSLGQYQDTRNDLSAVDQARASMFAPTMGNASNNFQANRPPNPAGAALGSLLGQAGSTAITSGINQSRDTNLINALVEANRKTSPTGGVVTNNPFGSSYVGNPINLGMNSLNSGNVAPRSAFYQ
jgi:hypothetical protein